MRSELERVAKVAAELNFEMRTSNNEYVVIFDGALITGGRLQINVYCNNKNDLYTVSTALKHPKKGKTQLHRKSLTFNQVVEILKEPRKHTGKGYYTK